MNIERLSLDSLQPHPLNARIYGAAESDQALIQSIEAVGVLNAIIVDQKGRILSGTRRWKACKALAERHGNEKFSQIPTEVFKGNELEAQRRLIHANRQRDKTLEQKKSRISGVAASRKGIGKAKEARQLEKRP